MRAGDRSTRRARGLSVSSVKSLEGTGWWRRSSWEGTVAGQRLKVRTKTFKFLEEPTEEELIVELSLLHRWIPLMVELGDSFDIDLNSLDDEAAFGEVENMLCVLNH
ncbi:unnamed protein product [Prorocentrum cordatum]|uniref:Uncharacterized protein n=1 Tax=Prorocentrum cordatum TaxID=2364126 RepID=A0ABN9U9K2_9DINO|nr:unnamed protein product [Polarella glacialis]